MMGKNRFEYASKRIEQHLSEINRAKTAGDISEFIGVSHTIAYDILQLMEAFGTVQKVRRGRHHDYFLTGVYDDEQISAMLLPERLKTKRQSRSILHNQKQSNKQSKESLLEEHLSTLRAQASSFEGPSALALIGLTQQDTIEEKKRIDKLPIDLEFEDRQVETPKKIKPFATIQHLPKDLRRLTLRQTKHLKEQLKNLDGYDGIENFKTAFVDFSALENGSYGNTFYFSMGTNPWENVYKVTLEDSLPLEMKTTDKIMSHNLKYDSIIDQLLESGQNRVEVELNGKKPSYIQTQLRRKIKARGLNVRSYSKRGIVYLERATVEINNRS